MKEMLHNLKKVYGYGKEYKKSLIIQVICCILGIITNVIFPLLSAKFIVDFTSSMWKQAFLMALVILVISVFNEIKTLVIRKNTQIFRRGTIRNIQNTLGKEILCLKQNVLDENGSGKYIQRLTNDTDKMASMFTDGMGRLTGFISNVGIFIAILIIDYHMFIFYISAALILTGLYYIKNEHVTKKEVEYASQSDKVAGLTGELVRGARDIKMLFAKQSFMKYLDSNVNTLSGKNFEVRNIDMKYNLFIGSLSDLFEFLTVLLLIYLVTTNNITVAVAIALYSYRMIVLTNLMSIVSSLLNECKNFNVACKRVFEILCDDNSSKEKFGTKHIEKFSGSLEFKNVSFEYDLDKKVLEDFDLKIEPNKTYGLVGKSGAGKSTIFNLLCKMYDVNKGQIFLDNIDIQELDEESIRGNITIINQNPYLFNMSIKENLMLVKSDITMDEIKEACKIACLDDYINSLPNGYDTIIGESGVILSGGQRQRLAIARALIQKTKIILFDEATSALDNETQSEIQKAINNLKGEYTVLIIAHRLSTIVDCDKIFVVNEGKVIDSGNHKELLKNCEFYKNLYNKDLEK